MQQYKDLMCELLETATFKEDRTGVNTVAKFGHQMRFNLQDGFPLVTLKHTPFHLIVKELLWFLEGNTNAHDLAEQGCHIWDNWALENGELGPIYGKQWRSWQAPDTTAISARIARIDEILSTAVNDHPLDVDKNSLTEARKLLVEMREHDATRTIDQIREVIDQIKRKPHSRRLIVSAWNPADMPDESMTPQENVAEGRMALAACHTMFQFFVSDMTIAERLNGLTEDQSTIVEGVKTLDPNNWAETDECYAMALDEAGVPRKKLSCQLYQRKPCCALAA